VPSLPALDPRLLLGRAPPARFPLDRLGRAGAHLFYLARAGVHHAVRHLLDGRSGTVLMPAYHHGVEVEAVRSAGARIAFYRVDGHMQADLDDLWRQARGAQLVYLTHFAGFAQPAAQVSAVCQERGLRLIEDCALALFSADSRGRPLGSWGDAAVYCLYKSLPVPHGGLLLCSGMPAPATAAPPLASTLHHLAGQLLSQLELRAPTVGGALRYAARSASRGAARLVENVQTGTMHLTPRDLALGASSLATALLSRFDRERIVARRRRNFQRLAAQLEHTFPVVGAPLPAGTCPLFVPVLVDDKRTLLGALHARGVDAVDFWSSGDPACDLDRFPEVAALRRHVLELPCHQSLDDHAIDRLAQVVNEVAEHA
jgi:dTDP-4-amino-4,6-dideoxygalactose transaminase